MPTEFSPPNRFVFGAGGHAKVVLDALAASGRGTRLFDGDPERAGERHLGMLIEYAVTADQLPAYGHLAIGDNVVRQRLLEQFEPDLLGWFSVLHKQSIVADSAELESGVFVAARAIVGPESSIATACIINHGAVVDHDCSLGPCCHVAPNATLGGGVTLGAGVLVGSGAVLLPGVRIGDNAKIGSGAVVTHDVPANTTVVGVPARVKN